MPCLPIRKKLLPSRKGWRKWKKSLRLSLQSKLHISKAIIYTTTTRLTTFFPFSGHHHQRYHQYGQQHHRHHDEEQKSATVYVDMLFSEKQAMNKGDEMGASTSGSTGNSTDNKGKVLGLNSGREAWKAYVSSMPPIRGIDERAEEFISKFRQEMRLQREQSILDFHEMLARSA